MHITLCKPGRIPVPAKGYGGTQRVVYWLGKALVELGHQVTLIAPPGSGIPGAELRVVRANQEDSAAWQRLVPDTADIVHCHFEPAAPPRKPFVWTLHGNGQPGQKFQPNALFVSRSSAILHGSQHFVHNGLDPDDYRYSGTRDDYALFLAKARWDVKNFRGAAEVARQAGVELRVLGSRNWPLNLQRWLPAIRGVRYCGTLGGEAKRDLLARARCLIFPVLWEEPFGLAVTETLVSGGYVAATPYGALPEIVTPEVGVLSAKAGVLAAAVRDPQRFEPAKCRQRVLDGFTHRHMARHYLAYYERLLAHGALGDGPAPDKNPHTPAGLLPWED